MSRQDFWFQANRNLIAKAIGELTFEEIISPLKVASSDEGSLWCDYRLNLASGINYQFKGWLTIFNYLRVKPESLKRFSEDSSAREPLLAGQFFIDAQKELGLTDIVLGQYLQEMQTTLYSDVLLLSKNHELRVEEMAEWDGFTLQGYLHGHPKVILNKGRIGWCAEDIKKYAPEVAKPFKLYWVAVQKKLLEFSHEVVEEADLIYQNLYRQSLSEYDLTQMYDQLVSQNLDLDQYLFLPVHPWQWKNIVSLQYCGEIITNEIVSLGEFGDLYLPQISLRTLSNISRPEMCDIKLPLSILNTSAVRGIANRYVKSSSKVSQLLAQLCAEDSFLRNSKTFVLEDIAGLGVKKSIFHKVKNAPYRFHESLGVIWRHRPCVNKNEKAIITGSLFHQDVQGKTLINSYIKHSGLTVQEWLKRYFKVVVSPLFHLQDKYGVGLVSHGQNIVLILENYIPVGMYLKDFHGDLRVSSEDLLYFQKELRQRLAVYLDQLPPEYLIHDLITGHIITVLRFISAGLREEGVIGEQTFYDILSESISEYIKEHGLINQKINLQETHIKRVLLNKVRFQIGYNDSAERPKPALGTDLINPLHKYAGEEKRNGKTNG